MRKVREVLRLHFAAELSIRAIARSLGASPSTVGGYLRRAKMAGPSWPLPASLDEAGDDASARLVPQDGERAGQVAEAAASAGEAALRDIMYAETKADAEKGIGAFVSEFEAKHRRRRLAWRSSSGAGSASSGRCMPEGRRFTRKPLAARETGDERQGKNGRREPG